MNSLVKISALLLAGGLLVPSTIAYADAPDAAVAGRLGTANRAPLARTHAVAQMKSAAVPAVETLPNGVVLVPTVDRIAPRVAISLLVGAGAADESAADAGWRRLLVNAMVREAPQGYDLGDTKTARDESLVRAAEALGGAITVAVGDDVIEISATGDSANGADLLKLALALLQNPRLSDESLEEARKAQLDRVGAQDLDAANRIDNAVRTQVFRDAAGNLVAYGLPDDGTTQSVESLDDARLRALQERLANAPLTVAVTGDLDLQAMRATLSQLPTRAKTSAPAPSFALPKTGAPSLKVREMDVNGAFVLVSYPLPNFDEADGPALRVLVAALSDAKGARLPARLSDSLVKGAPQAQSVSAQWLHRRYASEILITAQTSPQSVEGVKNVLLDEINKLRATPLSGTELERARAYARGDWALERQQLRDRAFLTGLAVVNGAPPDATWLARLDNVSAADVTRVANKYLKPYAVALVMPSE